MKCPKCGLEVSNDADYCNRCGEPLNNPVVSNRRHISEGEHSKDKTGEEKVDNRGLYLVVGLGLIIVLLLGVGAALSLNQPANNGTNNTTVDPNDNGFLHYMGLNTTGNPSSMNNLDSNSSEVNTNPVTVTNNSTNNNSSSDLLNNVSNGLTGDNNSSVSDNGNSLFNSFFNNGVSTGTKNQLENNLSGDSNLKSSVSDSVPELEIDDLSQIVSEEPIGFSEITYNNVTISSDNALYALANNVESESNNLPFESVSDESLGDNVISSSQYKDLAANVTNYVDENGDIPSTVSLDNGNITLTKGEVIKLFSYVINNNYPDEVNLDDIK